MTSTPGDDPFSSPAPGAVPPAYRPAAGPAQGMPGFGGAPASDKTNTLAIVAFVMAFVFSLAGLVLGFVARSQIKKSGEKGGGLALAAIIISALSIALVLLLLVSAVAFVDGGDTVVVGLASLR